MTMQVQERPLHASGTVSHRDCRLAWSEAGRGQPVLFIHGTAANVWGDLTSRTAAFARAIAYDRRSFGASTAPPLATLTPHATDAAAILEARQAQPAVVVGWSIGGVIAIELALSHPALVRALVLLEPPLWAKKHLDLNLVNGVALSIAVGLIAGPARGGRRFTRWAFRTQEGGNALDAVDVTTRTLVEANARAIGSEIRGGTGEHLRETDVRRLAVPTVIVAGTRSQTIFADAARRLAATLPAARLEVLDGASHLLQIERSDAIAAIIRTFVEVVDPPARDTPAD